MNVVVLQSNVWSFSSMTERAFISITGKPCFQRTCNQVGLIELLWGLASLFHGEVAAGVGDNVLSKQSLQKRSKIIYVWATATMTCGMAFDGGG